jgi:hypothetical protein
MPGTHAVVILRRRHLPTKDLASTLFAFRREDCQRERRGPQCEILRFAQDDNGRWVARINRAGVKKQ